MRINTNYKLRRFSGKSKNWCRREPEQIKNTHRPIYTSSENPSVNGRKIFFRSFRHRSLCKEFINEINFRYKRRFNQSINFRVNLRGNKIEYYGGGKCKI
tara:strand:+ start:82 stop:381 length:300 start_codon:yes stop_codon:yes gene_type:complete